MRVIVEVEGNEYRLVHVGHVDMAAPAQPVQLEGASVTLEGDYAELRNDRDEALYQHSLGQLGQGVEVFSSAGSARRVDVPPRKQTVMLVLPDEPAAESIVFMRAPVDATRRMTAEVAGGEPREVACFALTTGDSR